MQDKHSGMIFLLLWSKSIISGVNQQKLYMKTSYLKKLAYAIKVPVIVLDAVCMLGYTLCLSEISATMKEMCLSD